MGRHSAPDGEGAGVGVAELLRRSGMGGPTRPGEAARPGRRARHGAPDEGDETASVELEEAALATQEAALATQETERIVPLEPDVVPPPAEVTAESPAEVTAEVTVDTAPETTPAAAPSGGAPQAPARAPGGTHADLALLRSDATLRSRCAAAVIVPFVLYVVVLLVVGRMDVFLLWVWIPTVTAGVLVGTFLDIAHKRLDQPPS